MAKVSSFADAVAVVTPYVVRLSTPGGTGTGFLVSRSMDGSFSGIATAAHVVDHAHYWEEPIRIEHALSGESVLLRPDSRAVFVEEERDTAALLFDPAALPFPEGELPLIPEGLHLVAASAVGWLGFPAIAATTLCFFNGMVSAHLPADGAYLVDGVAINGVSGGPAFSLVDSELIVVGVVSAYMPNRATGETLPGLAVVRDVTQFQQLAATFESLDQAKAEETVPSSPPPPNPDAEAPTPSSRRTV